jgi:hypothetical protein
MDASFDYRGMLMTTRHQKGNAPSPGKQFPYSLISMLRISLSVVLSKLWLAEIRIRPQVPRDWCRGLTLAWDGDNGYSYGDASSSIRREIHRYSSSCSIDKIFPSLCSDEKPSVSAFLTTVAWHIGKVQCCCGRKRTCTTAGNHTLFLIPKQN